MKKIRSIPPITSTGSRVKNHSAPLSGLANISIGRYMSEMKKRNEDNDQDFNIGKYSKSEFNKKTPEKSQSPCKDLEIKPIVCDKTILKDKELKIILEFSGFNFLQSSFRYLETTKSFFIPIEYKDDSYLTLTTNGDIFEYEINYKECNFNRYHRDEIYIPELLTIYDSSTMNTTIKDKNIIITYKKK